MIKIAPNTYAAGLLLIHKPREGVFSLFRRMAFLVCQSIEKSRSMVGGSHRLEDVLDVT